MNVMRVTVKHLVQQGDSAPVPVAISIGGKPVDETKVSQVRMRLGPFSARYPGKLRCREGYWLFPLTQEQSYRLPPGENLIQAQVKVGDVVIGTGSNTFQVGESKFKGAW